MIEVEVNIDNQPITILIYYGASHSYINPNLVEIFHLQWSKHEKCQLVQLAMGDKRMIIELVKDCIMDMNGLDTKLYLNIIYLGSYDYLIFMDWLENNHDIIHYYNKEFTYVDNQGKQIKVKGIPRHVSITEISSMQLKKSFKKGCKIYATHMEAGAKDKIPSVEDHIVLKYF